VEYPFKSSFYRYAHLNTCAEACSHSLKKKTSTNYLLGLKMYNKSFYRFGIASHVNRNYPNNDYLYRCKEEAFTREGLAE